MSTISFLRHKSKPKSTRKSIDNNMTSNATVPNSGATLVADNPTFQAIAPCADDVADVAPTHENENDFASAEVLWDVAKALFNDNPLEVLSKLEKWEIVERAEQMNVRDEEQRDSTEVNKHALSSITINDIDRVLRWKLKHDWNTKTLAFVVGSTFGCLNTVKLLLTEKYFLQVDPSCNKHEAIHMACKNGHLEIVKLLLSDYRVDPVGRQYSDRHNRALNAAVTQGHCEIVALLVQDDRINQGLMTGFAFLSHCGAGDMRRVQAILADSQVLEHYTPDALPYFRALYMASNNGRTEIVKLLVNDQRLNPGLYGIYGFLFYCGCGDAETVKSLLLDPVLDPCAGIQWASARNHVAVVKLLLADSRVDPSRNDNAAVINVSESGCTEVLELLLAHKRVDASARQNQAVKQASRNGHSEVVRLLVRDNRVNFWRSSNFAFLHHCSSGDTERAKEMLGNPNVNPAAYNNDAVRLACENGRVGVVKLLLADARVNPTVQNNKAIIEASKGGYLSVVKLLLAYVPPVVEESTEIKWVATVRSWVLKPFSSGDERLPVDPSANQNEAFYEACNHNHASVVQLLLLDPRVNLLLKAEDLNESMRQACMSSNADVVQCLMSDLRVDPSFDDNTAIKTASKFANVSVIRLLLADARVDAPVQVLVDAANRNDRVVVKFFIAMQPKVLFNREISCIRGGLLYKEIKKWEAHAALLMLLAIKRTQTAQDAGRLSDVLREVVEKYTGCCAALKVVDPPQVL